MYHCEVVGGWSTTVRALSFACRRAESHIWELASWLNFWDELILSVCEIGNPDSKLKLRCLNLLTSTCCQLKTSNQLAIWLHGETDWRSRSRRARKISIRTWSLGANHPLSLMDYAKRNRVPNPRGGSRPGKTRKHRARQEEHERIWRNYFSENPIYTKTFPQEMQDEKAPLSRIQKWFVQKKNILFKEEMLHAFLVCHQFQRWLLSCISCHL